MPDQDPSRRFNTAQRVALLLASAGRCTACEAPLQPGWHGDHVVAYSAGGPTDVANGAATCPTCNLRKGARMNTYELRDWQRAALDTWTAHAEPDFLLVACPGAGKTRWALRAAQARLPLTPRLLVVVPSEQLKHQWARAGATVGIELKPDWRNSDGTWPADFAGVVVTYAQLARQPDLFRHQLAAAPTGVICDEIHHAGDQRTWGTALREAADPARWRLALSGTPFRSDGSPIPFITYGDGVCVADHTYGYGAATREGVCRRVVFPQYDGTVEWLDEQGVRTTTFNDDLDPAGMSRRLRTALLAGGGLLGAALNDADTQLHRLRTGRHADLDAGGLVIAMDQQHAVKVAGELEAISGEPVQVAISDDPDARASIDRFAASTSPWLVAVRMVSEGVDIPRLRVLVYATNVVAPLFFRQAVGRVVRTRSGRSAPADQLAYVYLPSDPRLRQHAAALEQEVSVALAEPAEDGQEQPAAGVRAKDLFAPLSSTGDLAQITEAGQTLSSTELARARQLARQVGFSEDPGDLARVARLLRLVTDSPATAEADPMPQPKYERVAALRQRASAVARRIALVTGTEFSHVNQRLNEAVGVRSIAEATEQQLIERITLAKRWLDSTEAA